MPPPPAAFVPIDTASVRPQHAQAFDFIGRAKFSCEAGELRVLREETRTWIEGDTDGDGTADLLIRLDGSMGLKEAVFEL